MKTVLLGLALVSVAACSVAAVSPTPASDPAADPPTALSTKSRIMAPAVAPADSAALASGNRQFATDLYQTLVADPAFAKANVFFSPHSISLALAMTYAGARGNTAKELAAALHFTLPQEKLHPAFDALDLEVSSRGADLTEGSPFHLRVTNSVWGASNTAFEPAFLDTLAENYGAGVRLTNFAADPEGARKRINGWVAKETDDRVLDILAPGTIADSTKVVLVDAIYFKAGWESTFGDAQPAPFHALDGSVPQALTMTQTTHMGWAHGAGYDAVELPYEGHQLSFLAVVPEAGTFGAFEASLSADKLLAITGSLADKEVELALPKFKIEGGSVSLKSALKARGVKDAFSDRADFSGISHEAMSISDVIHKAFIAVDERGTEAAAATVVIVDAGAAPPSEAPKKVTIDRPFVFAIRDNATGALLFLGRVIKP